MAKEPVFVEFNPKGNKYPKRLEYFVGTSVENILGDVMVGRRYESYKVVDSRKVSLLGMQFLQEGVDAVAERECPSYWLGSPKKDIRRKTINHKIKLDQTSRE